MASKNGILPDQVATSLKCSICKGYLSVGPIKISTDGTQYQCGRCDFTNSHINIRNYTYEKVAAYVMFPCIYKGCKKKITWNAVKSHELSCQYRTIRCIMDSCNVDLNTRGVISHFEVCHPHSIMKGNTVLPRGRKPSSSGIIIESDVPYFFIVYKPKLYSFGSSEIINFKVLTISNCPNKLTYAVTFSSDFEGKKLIFSGENVEVYNDRKHCVQCYLSRCEIKFHKYSNYFSNEPIKEFEVSTIINFLQSSTIYYYITIEADCPVRNKNTSLLRKTVECPICKDYMQAPIYSCKTGHIVCKVCKDKLSSCPTCQADITATRSFTLEELCENIRLSCENRGCHVVDSLKHLQIHENNCQIIKASGDTSIIPVAPQRKSIRKSRVI